jgi:integrase
VYPHAFRHYLVTEFSRKNIPPVLIKDLVGWTSTQMVDLYNDLGSKDKQWEELNSLKENPNGI